MARVLLFCLDKVGSAMAGPAIRYWEMARALARHHTVTLLTLTPGDAVPEGFAWKSLVDTKLRIALGESDILITQRITHRMAFHAKRLGVRMILDAYDPMPLENLEVYRHHPAAVRTFKHESICRQFNFAFRMADALICANQRQRDLWMGLLLGLGKVTTAAYERDPSLSSLLAVVPFGLSSQPPQRTGPGLRQRHQLPDDAIVLLWGGGIWNWFDPLTLIRAIGQLASQRRNIHLCFMGIKHPNEAIPEMEMCRNALNLARELDLLDKHVHVHYGWTPYDARQNCLLDADIGVSTHFDHLETHYSFRTRILDYLWAGLPIIATEGDAFADLIASRQLGITVPFRDSHALAHAIATLADDPATRQRMSANIAALRPSYQWDTVTAPLAGLIEQLLPQRPKLTFNTIGELTKAVYNSRGPHRIFQYARARLSNG